MKISIMIEAPELANAISKLAASLTARGQVDPGENNCIEYVSPNTSSVDKKVTVEEIRAKLAELVELGKQHQVKELISKYGVKKLNEVPPENYADLLKAIEQI